jgi:hypothetical protein
LFWLGDEKARMGSEMLLDSEMLLLGLVLRPCLLLFGVLCPVCGITCRDGHGILFWRFADVRMCSGLL